MTSEPGVDEQRINRARHLRAIWFVFLSFCLAAAGYLWLGLSRDQTIGYCVAAYLALNILNYRAMFAKTRKTGSRQ